MTLKTVDSIDRLISYVKTYDPEIWKDVEGYKGMYQVSNKGRVRSFAKPSRNNMGRYQSSKKDKSKIKKYWVNNKGYKFVALYKNNQKKNYKIARLVGKAFVSNPENKPHINHDDGNKLNDHATNLEWMTPSENRQHAWDMGLHEMTPEIKQKIREGNQGENGNNAILTEEDVLEIRKRYENEDIYQRELGEEYGVSASCVSGIIRRQSWDHI